jgi:hypothetical protein
MCQKRNMRMLCSLLLPGNKGIRIQESEAEL